MILPPLTVLALGITLTACALFLKRRGGLRMNWGLVTIAFFGLDYLIPAALEVCEFTAPKSSPMANFPGLTSSALPTCAAAAGAIAFTIGYSLISARPRTHTNEPPVPREFFVLATILLAVLLVCWLTLYGGIGAAVQNIYEIRARRWLPEANTLTPTLGYTKSAWVFAALATIAVSNRMECMQGTRIWALATLTLSALLLVLRGGRGAVVDTLVVVMLCVSTRGKRVWRLFLIVAAMAVLILVLLKPAISFATYLAAGSSLDVALSESWSDLNSRTDFDSGTTTLGVVAGDLSHFSIGAALASSELGEPPNPERVLDEIMIAFGKLLPTTIYEPTRPSLSVDATRMIYATEESIVPPGIVAAGIMSVGLLGMPILLLACGVTVRLVELAWNSAAGAIQGCGSTLDAAGAITVGSGVVAATLPDTIRELTVIALPIAIVGFATSILHRTNEQRRCAVARRRRVRNI